MKTTLEMQNEIQKNFNFLELAEEYKGANEKILIRCNNCGYEWKAVPRSVKNSCSNLNIKLLEISYKEDNQNIEFLIKNFLNLPSVNEKSDRLQQGNIGEGCDANTEITKETKESLIS